MKKAVRAVLFDLDGTLANTLADLANAVNYALTALGLPPHPVCAYRHMVGDGARVLCQRAVPAERKQLIPEALRLMREHYDAHCFDETRLYPGIPELVAELHGRNIKMAVFSNKPDEFTVRMITHYFGPARFDAVRGHRANAPLKPDPTVALEIACEFGIAPAEWLYLGDTNTDMSTALGAGMYPVGVLWGFREREELLASGAKTIIRRPVEVLDLLSTDLGCPG